MEEVHRTPWFNKDGYLACTAYYSDGSRKTIHQHREVMEKHLGRAILPGHVIHHKDENRSNNGTDNLEEKLSTAHARDHRPEPELQDVVVLL